MLAAGGAAQTQSRRRLPAQLQVEAACRLGSNLNGQVSGEALKLEKKLTSTTSLRRLLGSGRSGSDAGRWRPASEPGPVTVTVPVRAGPESACSQPEPRLQVRHTLARFDSESRSLDSESQARRLESESESAESSHTVVVHALRLAKLQTPPA